MKNSIPLLLVGLALAGCASDDAASTPSLKPAAGVMSFDPNSFGQPQARMEPVTETQIRSITRGMSLFDVSLRLGKGEMRGSGRTWVYYQAETGGQYAISCDSVDGRAVVAGITEIAPDGTRRKIL